VHGAIRVRESNDIPWKVHTMAKNVLSIRPQSSFGAARDRAYEHMQRIGIRYLELRVAHPSLARAEQAKYEPLGLSAASVHGQINMTLATCALSFEPWAVACQYLGAKVMFVATSAGDLDRRIAYNRLYECGEVAARYDVTICLETHPNLMTNMTEAVQTIKRVDHPNVRINFDMANIYYNNENIDGLAELRHGLDYIGAVHLKEHNGKHKDVYFPALGDPEGIIDWKQVYETLNGHGFYGPFTIEIEGKGDRDIGSTAELHLQRVVDSVAHLRELGLAD